ncbi:aminoglycoside phosphotransferase family protein [Nakamurella deserti]|uniref:aminoglycoside phosphotransferase family protein n=1 Tax=Nakamurella deserti TaxID=2164074 RepID=UPI000DBE10B7|nr:aminoglycoside phosphotransferase family protein [Nakamurella deserti]
MTGPDLPALPESMLDEPPDALLGWASPVLADAGFRPSGEPLVRRREWSTVVRWDTDRGPVWVKGNARPFGVEAALLGLLARHARDHVVPPIALDPVRCRMVLPDGGRTLRESGAATEAAWTGLLTGYADLQAAMARHPAALRAAGLPDLTPSALPAWYRLVLDRIHAEPALEALLDDGALEGLEELVPATAALAAELPADGLPVTVEHNDLHPGNVFAGGGGRGMRLFDWGDAVLAHPLHVLGRTVATAVAELPGDDPRAAAAVARRLREALLRTWCAGGPVPAELHRSATIAAALSQITTTASRLRMPLTATRERRRAFVELLTGYAGAVPALLRG